MSILLSLLLSQAGVLPQIDRRALDLQAQAEALQGRPNSRRAAVAAAPRSPEKPPIARLAAAATGVRRTVETPVRRSAEPSPVRRASVQTAGLGPRPGMPMLRHASGGAMDLASITTVCRAAGGQNDPATYLSSYSRAYSLSGAANSALRTSCAAYLAGRADARINYGR